MCMLRDAFTPYATFQYVRLYPQWTWPLVVLCCAVPSSAEETIPKDALLAAFRENGERLRSGEYTATGILEYRAKGQGDEQPRLFEEQIDCSFDYNRGSIMFSRVRRQIEGDDFSLWPRLTKSWLILTPDRSVQGRLADSTIATVSIDVPTTTAEAPEFFQPVLDVRSIGYSRYATLGLAFETQLGALESAEFAVADEGGGILRMWFDDQYSEVNGGDRYTVWVDESQSLQAVRLDVQAVRFSDPVEVGSPHSTTETSWTQRDDIWVPESLVSVGHTPTSVERLHLDFDWDSVNQPIPDSRFEWQTLSLPERSHVADVRVSKENPIPVASTGFPMERELPKGTADSDGSWTNSGRYLLIGNVMLLAALGGWCVRRYWSRARSRTP